MIEEGRFHSIRQQDDTHRDPDVEVSHHSKLLLGHGRRVQRHEQEMQQSTQNTWQPVQCRLTGQLFERLHETKVIGAAHVSWTLSLRFTRNPMK